MLRLGIVDFDSSHSLEFTQRFNHCGVDAEQRVDGARVVLGCPGDSTMSAERIPGFARQIASCGVELADSPDRMIGRIDAVLVLSICGSAHLERVAPFLTAGIPAFVDKPFACSLEDAVEMARLARQHQTLLFTSSSLRFSEDIFAFEKRRPLLGKLHGATVWGPAKRHPGNPGLFHYGIHAVETLFTLMGPGCERVSASWSEGAEVVTGHWSDGRLGTIRGIREGCTSYGATAYCDTGVFTMPVSSRYAYRNLCREIVKAFETGRPPVPIETSLEIVRFIVAALESEHRDGAPVALPEIAN